MNLQEGGNEGQLKWHDSNCSRYYRCWNGNALELTCPFVAPNFDSCRKQCLNDANAVCGDPGDRCGIVQTTTTTPEETTSSDPDEDTTTSGPDPDQTTQNTVPSAPSNMNCLKSDFYDQDLCSLNSYSTNCTDCSTTCLNNTSTMRLSHNPQIDLNKNNSIFPQRSTFFYRSTLNLLQI
jgi:hypothetical protein